MIYAASHRVAAAGDADGYMQLLNLRNKQLAVINPTMRRLWGLLEEGLELDAATTTLSTGEGVPVSTLRRDLAEPIAELESCGMLATRWRQPGRLLRAVIADGSSPSRVTVTTADEQAPAHYTVAGAVGFAVAILLQRLPLPFTLQLMRGARRLRPQHPALTSSRQLVATVRRLARHHPGWADCYEISMGAFLAAALLGCAPTWSLGADIGSRECHAFLQVDGTAVDHSEQTVHHQTLIRLLPGCRTRRRDPRVSSRGVQRRRPGRGPVFRLPGARQAVRGRGCLRVFVGLQAPEGSADLGRSRTRGRLGPRRDDAR